MSSATVHPDARSALRTALQTVSGLPQAAWEGFKFTPTQGVAFIEDQLVGGGDVPISNRAIEHRMSYLVTLKYPSDAGTAAIEAMAGALLDLFKVGTTLNYGTTGLTCMKAERRGAILQVPEWAVLTVMVTLVAFTLE